MNKRILAASLVLLTTASVAQAATYTVTLIGGSLGGLEIGNTPRALNDSGQIVGESLTTGNAQTRPALWNGQAVPVELEGFVEGVDGRAFGMNNSGQVVGTDGTPAQNRATLWNNTQNPRNLGTLNDSSGFSQAYDINNSGQVVGDSSNGAINSRQAFLWEDTIDGGAMLALDFLSGGNVSSARSINDVGQIAGYSNRSAVGISAVLWDNSPGRPITEMGTLPGDSNSVAFDINLSGTVVGYSSGSTGDRAFIWDYASEQMTDLGTLGDDFSRAKSINDSGLVVGRSAGSAGSFRNFGFLWDETNGMRSLDSLLAPAYADWGIYDAVAINSAGQILGWGRRNNSGMQGMVLLTPVAPVPLPAVVWLMLSGLASLGWLKHRRAAAC